LTQGEIRAEGKQRLEELRTRMRERGLDALLIFSQRRGHVAYVSGYIPNYHTNSAVVILPVDAAPVLLIRFGFDLPRARALSWFEDIRTADPSHPGGFLQQCFQTAVRMKLGNGRIGLVAGDETVDEMGLSLIRSLEQELPHARVQHVTEIVTRMRMSKRPTEVQRLRRATELAEHGAVAVKESLVPGNEDFEAMGAAAFAAIRGGADRCDAFISTRPDRLALPPLHHQFEQGSPVNIELTVLCEGYWVQICRSYALGGVSPTQRRLFQACSEGYQSAANLARPGKPIADLARAAAEPLSKSGFPGCVQYGLGHGVGLDIPEPYDLDLGCRELVVDNMILVVHVGAWASDRQAAAFVGGPILIQSQGVTHLHQPQLEMIEV